MKILLIEDSSSVRNVLKMSLEAESFAIDEAENGEDGSYMARVNKYDLIILDNILPKKFGRQVCKEIRDADVSTPILILSGKNETNTKIELLGLGADDYITKPFSFEELKARIKALLRRPHKIEDVILKNGNLRLNTNTHEVTRNSKRIYLTRKEFSLLETFMRNQDRVLSRSFIMEHVWETNVDPFSNTIESHVLNLRRKIGDRKKSLITNIPGRGYKMISQKNFK